MKKDIIIPEVENVFLAAVQEWSDDLWKSMVRLINDSDFLIESNGFKKALTINGEMKKHLYYAMLLFRFLRCLWC
jgi:hypothetical protein